ncbi:ATP-binding cassette domain-containing protein, partial [Xanthomonas citri pv. citri]|nr:ATP-binding cassette domain-containing protein [Xanthomonas citri pv. citri]
MVSIPTSISVEKLSVRYNNGHLALYDVSFQLQNGTICALIGVNGGGKSTLFKSLMGLVKPQTGTILLNRMPIQQALKQNLVS